MGIEQGIFKKMDEEAMESGNRGERSLQRKLKQMALELGAGAAKGGLLMGDIGGGGGRACSPPL